MTASHNCRAYAKVREWTMRPLCCCTGHSKQFIPLYHRNDLETLTIVLFEPTCAELCVKQTYKVILISGSAPMCGYSPYCIMLLLRLSHPVTKGGRPIY